MALPRGVGKGVAAPLLVWNLLLYIVVVGLSGWMLSRAIDQGGFGGNRATPFFAISSLIAGMVGIAAVITGLHHVRVWRAHSGASAQAASWIAWLLLVLAFFLATREIHIGGRGMRYRVLEGFVIMLTLTKLVYTLALYFAEDRHDDVLPTTAGVHHGKTGHHTAPSANPMAASAV